MHVMSNARLRLEAGHRDFVNEIRICTLLFFGFPSLTVGLNPYPKPYALSPKPFPLFAHCCGQWQLGLWLQEWISNTMIS